MLDSAREPMRRRPAAAVIAMGANLGDPERTLRAAARTLTRLGTPGGASALYRTAPVGGPGGQPDFVNAVLILLPAWPYRTPERLLAALLALEVGAGRRRDSRQGGERWGPRTLDLDLISLGSVRRDASGVTVPHPRATERAFVMVPLAEAWPEWRAPDGRSAREIAAALDRGGVVDTGRHLLP